MADNGDRNLKKALDGIVLVLGEIRDLRAESERRWERWEKQAAEDRRQAAEDRKQAAEDRRQMHETIDGVREALKIIGRRGRDFVSIQNRQSEQIGRLIDVSEKTVIILDDIRKTLRRQGNGKGGNGG